MIIYSLHERLIQSSPDKVGALLDTLAGPEDSLWPGDNWPPMGFDAALGAGASGGHGPVRYHVSEYLPGRRVEFRFDPAGIVPGLRGRHFFEVIPDGDHTTLRHVIDGTGDAATWLKWKLMVEPLHDALLQDALDLAENRLGADPPKSSPWGFRVGLLRWFAARAA